MSNPEWMKPHLRARLEQERKEATRTGPVNGEKALTAENGKVKEVITNHKPAPSKNCHQVGDSSFYMLNGKPTRGTIKSVKPAHDGKFHIEVDFGCGTVQDYIVPPKGTPPIESDKALQPKAPKNGMDWKAIEQSIGRLEFAELMAQQLSAHQEEMFRILGLTSGKKRMSWRELQENQE